ncbi:hypothetical protein LV84_02503 [Algoriphagus ratkowskyi]|uniref:Uncharacterized protein n=1 Tax=Algoriphagus ratkowskyi TaxID=57028 RepID=A0A2W7RWT8_9BACT|nr:hypothetical protein [Algoriphagus ratkowskyi]PZX55365.1 hypothetical protein LV84_02503 [Algoriphagus ratkowskyi]TXD79704.1 hypothetical protein ESW18_00815 [Algoriphagus ratkowskyi]
MANLTSDQAIRLSDNFYYLSSSMLDFRVANWEKLSDDDIKELSDIQYSLLSFGENILALSTTLIMDEVVDSLGKINTITQEIKDSIKDLKNIQKGLNVATGILILGAMIINRDPQGIGSSLKDLFELWKAPLD